MKNFYALKIAASDCPKNFRSYTQATDDLKSLIDIKSKILQDFTTIRANFPCSVMTVDFLRSFVSKQRNILNSKKLFFFTFEMI